MKFEDQRPVTAAAAPRSVWMIDTTLRDGEQAPGIVFSLDTKRTLAKGLAEAGVNELEVGTPAMGRRVRDEIRALAGLNLPCLLTCWCRALETDVALAARCATGGVHISFPVSTILLDVLDKRRSWVMAQLKALVTTARESFRLVSVGAQDAFRADPDFLKAFIAQAAASGVHRVRLADTVGTARPLQVAGLVQALSPLAGETILEFHGHNDLGMATANTLTAVEAGIGAVSGTVNGLGERAGNAPLEQIATAVALLEGCISCVDIPKLVDVCRWVAHVTRRPIPVDQPITGEGVFRHESGIHVRALLRDPRTYQPFMPGLVGQDEMQVVAGRHSGRAVLRHLMAQAGVNLSEADVRPLLEAVREETLRRGKALSAVDLKRLHRRLVSSLS